MIPDRIECVKRRMEVGRMDARKTLRLEEAGRVLGLGRSASYDAARRGEIPVLRFGRRLLVSQVALDAMLRAGTNRTTTSEEVNR